MNPDITPEAPQTTRRVKPFALRLPSGLAVKIEQKSKMTGLSMNQLIVQSVALFMDEGGPATEERIELLERDVARTVQAIAGVGVELERLSRRLDNLERLARQSGADI